jgi:hypothetical protein
MDLKKYNELRKKISTKDFEGNNKGLDRWLWRFSFIGNASAIFFAYFLVYPALLKTITLHFMSGFWGNAIAFSLGVIFLTIFEVTKRYLVRNFSSDYMANRKKLNTKIIGWFTTALAIIMLSFYLSITGSKNLASTSVFKNEVIETEVSSVTDSLTLVYDARKKTYLNDNERLRVVTNDLRERLAETPLNYMSARRDYQSSIDKNAKTIADNQAEISKIDLELNAKVSELKNELITTRETHKTEDTKNIFLFTIIVIFNELIIIGGIYFREYFEHTLFEINHQKFEKIYQKKDRYRALLAFVYGDGKLVPGDQVLPGQQLKEIVAEKTNIPNSNKLVDEFLQDMDRLTIFVTHGKRRRISASYIEAVDIVERFDDAFRVLENMK